MDIVGQLAEGTIRFSAQESRVAAFILHLSFTAALRLMNWRARWRERQPIPAARPSAARIFVICESKAGAERRTSWFNEESAALPRVARQN